METEPRIAKLVAKITGERGCRVGKSFFAFYFILFFNLMVDREFVGKNAFWVILHHEQQVTACCQTHSDNGPPQISLKLAV